MIKDKILNKIEKLILKYKNKNISEEFVVNLLVNIRKFIDVKNIKNNYKILYLYCNWILHYQLDRKDAKDILKNLEDDIVNKKSLSNSQSRQELMPSLGLKKELNSFLIYYNLSKNIFDNYIGDFILKLTKILTDCPLKTNDEECKIKSFSFTKNDNEKSFNYLMEINNNRVKELRGNFTIKLI